MITELPFPSVAAMQGLAFGGGLELALACTFRIASIGATFCLPEIKLDAFPAYGGTARLSRLIGKQKAMKMMLSGEPIDAHEALAIGLVDGLAEDGVGVSDAARNFISPLTTGVPSVIASIYKLTLQAQDGTLQEALDREAAEATILTSKDDVLDGFRRFIEARPRPKVL